MSIKERIKDADILFKLGRKEGALLLILVAVAGTSRKRYPKNKFKDDKAFMKFVSEEMSKYAPGWKRDSKVKIKIQDRTLWMPHELYKFVRCELFHEAQLPSHISFKDGEGFNVTVRNNEQLIIGNAIFHYLRKIVIEAPENNDLFNMQS
jgi:hypothetical protein